MTPPAPTTPEEVTDALVTTYEAELACKPEPARAARLHTELGWILEHGRGELERASTEYQKALAQVPDFVPALRAARRASLRAGRVREALKLFDREASGAAAPAVKAALLYEKAWWLEALGDRAQARDTCRTITHLDPTHASAIAALLRADHVDQRPGELASDYEQLANALDDGPHRAALLAQRASLVELALDDPQRAAGLYQAALDLDPRAVGARACLDHLHYRAGRHTDRIPLLEQRASQTEDATTRAVALQQVARIHAEHLGALRDAAEALERAVQARPDEPLILEDLVDVYERSARYQELVYALQRLVQVTYDPKLQVARLHRIGELLAYELGHIDDAVAAYRHALHLAPTHVPTLEELASLYRSRGQWEPLAEIWHGEAEAAESPERRARAYVRIAELWETRLGRPDRAIEGYDRALQLHPGHVEAFKALERLYETAGQHRALVQLYERAVDSTSSPDRQATYLFQMGRLYEHGLGDSAQAMEAYRRARDLTPSRVGAMHAMQRAAERAGDHHALVHALDDELQHTSDTAQQTGLLNRIATVLRDRLGDADGAASRLRKVLEIDARNADALEGLARIEHERGHWEPLLTIYEAQLEGAQGALAQAELRHRMGALCETRLGRPDDAAGHYRTALRACPGYEPSLRALDGILRGRGAWRDLAAVWEEQAQSLQDQPARARAHLRAAWIYDEHLGQPGRAIRALDASLEAQPGFRPAVETRVRVREAQRQWEALNEALEQDEQTGQDPDRVAADLWRRGEVFRHRLGKPTQAVDCFEMLRAREPGELAALIALERLYEAGGRRAQLGGIYRRAAERLRDAPARIAALRELARLQMHMSAGTPMDDAKADKEGTNGSLGDPTRTFGSILQIAPNDLVALELLEHLAVEREDTALRDWVDRRLGETAADGGVAAAHLGRLAHRTEPTDAASARELYRAALERAPDSLPAIRGLGRAAGQTGDRMALAEAKRREAELTLQRAHAADLLTDRADLALAEGGPDDVGAAVQSVERALERAPDHERAAEKLVALLSSSHVPRLIDVLSKAAHRAHDHERASALWQRIAELHVAPQRDLGSAIHALERALERAPQDVRALGRLAELYASNGQWKEAVARLERVVKQASDSEMLVDAYLRLAEAHLEHLGAPEQAAPAIEHVLAARPDQPRALGLRVRLERARGQYDSALDTARRLASVSSGVHRAEALVEIAHIQRERGHDDAYVEALTGAVEAAGVRTEAARDLGGRLHEPRVVKAYADALATFLQSATETEDVVAAYLELARVYADALAMVDTAVDTLQQGLQPTRGDIRVAAELARRLSQAGRGQEAVAHLQRAVQLDVANPDLWRTLSNALAQAQRSSDAAQALEPVVALGVAGDAEQRTHRELLESARSTELEAGDVGSGEVAGLAVEGVLDHPATRLLGVLCDAIPKLYPSGLEAFGLTKGQRLGARSTTPPRPLASRIGSIVGAKTFEVYVASQPSPTATLAIGDPPAVVWSEATNELADAQQTFLMAWFLVALANRFHPVHWLPDHELTSLLTTAGHMVSPEFGTDVFDAETLDARAQRLRKSLSWLGRRPVEEAAQTYVTSPLTDVSAWARGLRCTAARAAAVLTADLPACVEALHRVSPQGQGTDRLTFVRSDPVAADLLGSWMTDATVSVRRGLGLS